MRWILTDAFFGLISRILFPVFNAFSQSVCFSYEALIEAHPTGTATDAYLVNGIIYVWDNVNNEWKNSGSLKGPKGDKGDTGEKGATGDTGDKGDTGEKGSKGDKGETGATGQKGDTGDTGPVGPAGQTGQKGDTGAIGIGTTIKGSYNTYRELIAAHQPAMMEIAI